MDFYRKGCGVGDLMDHVLVGEFWQKHILNKKLVKIWFIGPKGLWFKGYLYLG
jgi:hypothetical protein